MSNELMILILAALSIGFFHTLLGPDHYLPFIVLSHARNWTVTKTALITVLCGIGHVGSSVVLGLLGVALGIGISKIEAFESFRGNLAGWAFIAFGLGYLLWGLWKIRRKKPHSHIHYHEDGTVHEHSHGHSTDHLHQHSKVLTPWILFIIFVLGPCEPLIPLLMYPAATSSISGMILVTAVFSLTTILTMLTVVTLAYYGIPFLPMKKAEKYMHVIAGATILLSGVGIQFLGL
ncbi:MAG: sulfite exporter TauE/SafE family protein [Bacteroidales bacterium]|nr:sulfite exporter TauE/SafE family protein [Bacteroidales bacterium]